jgi:Fic family protein
VTETRGLQVATSTAVKERRLATLLAGRDPQALGLTDALSDAQIAGSLELSGVPTTRETARDARSGAGSEEARRLYQALHVVPAAAPFSVELLRTWHAAVMGAPSRYRAEERPAAAPVEFIASRLAILEQWLNAESRRQLKPEQAGALVLARVLEIVPFETGNGRVARLAASHLMVQGGASPPILWGADAARLAEAVTAAFQLVTAPLAALLEEASGRKLDVMIQALE